VSSHASRFALAAVLILSGAAARSATAPAPGLAAARPGDRARPARPAAPPGPTVTAGTAPSRPVDLYLGVGYDVGFTTLVDVTYSDGSSGSLKRNGGLVLAAGATFLKLLDGKVSTRPRWGSSTTASRPATGA